MLFRSRDAEEERRRAVAETEGDSTLDREVEMTRWRRKIVQVERELKRSEEERTKAVEEGASLRSELEQVRTKLEAKGVSLVFVSSPKWRADSYLLDRILASRQHPHELRIDTVLTKRPFRCRTSRSASYAP